MDMERPTRSTSSWTREAIRAASTRAFHKAEVKLELAAAAKCDMGERTSQGYERGSSRPCHT